ncbi:MAG: lactate utilization protein [Pseudomonadota bacterium]|nr:lactate utilization protein [Pseudomonadota bacterium]
MSKARQIVLDRIRASLGEAAGSDDDAAARRNRVEKRLRGHPKGVVPEPPGKTGAVVNQFIAKARMSGATVEKLDRDEVAAAISNYLRDHNLPPELRMGEDRRLKRFGLRQRSELTLHTGASDGNDLAGLSYAIAGAGETGTLVLASGPDNPTTVNFLPENHIVVVDSDDIEFNYETIWTKIRRKYGAGNMPRSVNLITGPSRSADIEQTLIMGAHGPVRLHVIVVSG